MTPNARRVLPVASVLALWIAAFALFLWVQRGLSLNGSAESVTADLRLSALRFGGASLAMAALILGAGRRLLFALPIVALCVLPALVGGMFDCWSWDQSRVPSALGAAWWHTAPASGCVGPFLSAWFGVAVDLGLVLLPAIALALVAGEPARRAAPTAASTLVALAGCGIALAFTMALRGFTDAGDGWPVWIAFHVPLLSFGALLGIRGSWWTLALVVVPVALFPTLSLSSVVPVALDPLGAVYLVGVTAIGAAWRPLAVAIDRGRPALRRLSEEPVAAPAGS